MKQPIDSTFIPCPTATDPAEDAAGGGPKRGRPSGYAPKIIDMMCDKIRRFGLSDSAAAEFVGMSSSTISRWKELHPEIVQKLQQARQEIRLHHLEVMEQAAQAENGRGWRASAWMLERLFAADYARKISDRFDALSLGNVLKDREAHEALEVRLKELHAMQDAERAERAAAAQEAAVQAAAEAAAAAEAMAQEAHACDGAGAVSQASGMEGETLAPQAEALRFYSEGASHNSRNSGSGDEPSALDDAARPAESGEGASAIYSESDAQNSRNSSLRDVLSALHDAARPAR